MDMYIMYPGIIDSIFQTMLCNIMEEAKKTAGNKTMIPYYIEEITYNYIPYKTLWCRAHTELKDDVVHGSSEIFNESGEIIMKISNFTAKLTDRATLLRATEKNYNSFYYHTEWMLSDKASRNTKADKPMKYISISNNAALLEKICGALQKERANAEAVFIGKSGASTYSIDDITQKSNWMLLLSQINEDNKDERLKFIYHYETVRDAFGSGSAGGNIDFLALRGLSNLTQSIIESGLEGKASIKILTANVQNPDDSKDKLLNLSQSLLWGYAKVLSIEYSDIFDGIIDFDDGSVNDLAEEIARSGEYELCLHNGASYTPVLRRHKDYLKRNIKNPESIKILPAGSYLITGGTGALGMVYAEYLVNSGAKNIFLLDRKQPSEDVDKKINELKGMGASIRLLFADINDKYSLATALSSIKEEFPAIRGVIHAAGALNDKMIADLSWEDFEIVLGAKVAGLANLYGLLDLEQVDFLMLLSSVTSAFGNVGQANYAAANYFLNTFANDLAFNNQKAFTPCWGPWLSGGMASSNELISKNIAATGIEPIAPDIGLEIISGFFERPFKNPIIVDINWNIYMNNLNAKPAGNYLSQILSERSLKKSADENKQIAANVSVDKLNTCPQEERKTVLSDDLQKICGNIMGFGKGQRVDKNIAIKEQGADSLMVFSMRSTVNKLYSVDLSVSDFFDYPTINRLSDHLIDDILFAQAAEDMDSIDNESTEDLLFELEALAS
jgi:acyl carrier protein